MTLLLLYLTLALVVSFLCSLLEAVLLSLTASHISMLEQQGQPAGAGLRRLKEDINPPLAAILTLNTAAHTIGAAGVGAQAQVVFGSGYMARSEEHTSELQSRGHLVCRLLLEH